MKMADTLAEGVGVVDAPPPILPLLSNSPLSTGYSYYSNIHHQTESKLINSLRFDIISR